MSESRTDLELLRATPHEPVAFGVFYARHEKTILLFRLRRTGDPELAADLAAETFAQALVSCDRFSAGPAPPIAWLIGIARNTLAMSRRRGRVEAAARTRLAMEPTMLDDEDLERLERLNSEGLLTTELDALPREQREAIQARVVDEREYREIAQHLRCSEQVVRKRVSRGLSALRKRLEANA
jgi:RNA polymerase sigma factor (sigma-70 family)